MARWNRSTPARRRRALLDLLLCGVACGLLIAVAEITELAERRG